MPQPSSLFTPPAPSARADQLVPSWREEHSSWPCPVCDCRSNLRGLLACAHCSHVRQPSTTKEDPHVPESGDLLPEG
jgi:hypothetical protein